MPRVIFLKGGVIGTLVENRRPGNAPPEDVASENRGLAPFGHGNNPASAGQRKRNLTPFSFPPPVINKGGRPKGIPNKVTPTVAGMILQMKTEKKKVAVIARELNLSRQTVYEVLRRA